MGDMAGDMEDRDADASQKLPRSLSGAFKNATDINTADRIQRYVRV